MVVCIEYSKGKISSTVFPKLKDWKTVEKEFITHFRSSMEEQGKPCIIKSRDGILELKSPFVTIWIMMAKVKD